MRDAEEEYSLLVVDPATCEIGKKRVRFASETLSTINDDGDDGEGHETKRRKVETKKAKTGRLCIWYREKQKMVSVLDDVDAGTSDAVLKWFDPCTNEWNACVNEELQGAMLVLACKRNHVQLAWILLQTGIPLHQRDRRDTPLFTAVCVLGYVEMARMMLNNGLFDSRYAAMENNNVLDGFYHACKKDQIGIVKLLWGYYSDSTYNSTTPLRTSVMLSALSHACAYGSFRSVRHILTNGSVDVSMTHINTIRESQSILKILPPNPLALACSKATQKHLLCANLILFRHPEWFFFFGTNDDDNDNVVAQMVSRKCCDDDERFIDLISVLPEMDMLPSVFVCWWKRLIRYIDQKFVHTTDDGYSMGMVTTDDKTPREIFVDAVIKVISAVLSVVEVKELLSRDEYESIEPGFDSKSWLSTHQRHPATLERWSCYDLSRISDSDSFVRFLLDCLLGNRCGGVEIFKCVLEHFKDTFNETYSGNYSPFALLRRLMATCHQSSARSAWGALYSSILSCGYDPYVQSEQHGMILCDRRTVHYAGLMSEYNILLLIHRSSTFQHMRGGYFVGCEQCTPMIEHHWKTRLACYHAWSECFQLPNEIIMAIFSIHNPTAIVSVTDLDIEPEEVPVVRAQQDMYLLSSSSESDGVVDYNDYAWSGEDSSMNECTSDDDDDDDGLKQGRLKEALDDYRERLMTYRAETSGILDDFSDHDSE